MTDFEEYRKQPLHNSLEYAHMLKKLFPKGKLWGFVLPSEDDVLFDSAGDYPIIEDDPSSVDVINDSNVSLSDDKSSTLGKFCIVVGEELARFEIRCFNLVDESVPGLSVELIPEYKEQYVRDNLELSLIESDEDIARLAHGKEYNESVPFTKANAEAYGLTLGFTIDVNENSISSEPLICGIGKCGLQRCGGRSAFSIVEIDVLAGTANYELMQELFEKSKPAHVLIVWNDLRP